MRRAAATPLSASAEAQSRPVTSTFTSAGTTVAWIAGHWSSATAPLGVVATASIAAFSSSIAQFGAATKATYCSAAASTLITSSFAAVSVEAEVTGADTLGSATAAPSSSPQAAPRRPTVATQIHPIATWP